MTLIIHHCNELSVSYCMVPKCGSVWVCVCLYLLFVNLSVPKKAYASKWDWKVCLRPLALSTHTKLPKEGCDEVIQATAICKSICCLQISFLQWVSESHNSLAFPGQFPSAKAAEDLIKATYPICVSVGQETESRCVPSWTTKSPRSSFCGMEGAQVVQWLPIGTTNFTASIMLIDDPHYLGPWWP